MKAYLEYPKFHSDGKDIIFTKSDNFYKVSTFFDVMKSVDVQMFVNSCESLSVDKELNQTNMDYSVRSFKKSPIRAKDVKIRMILNDSSTTHIVSNFLIEETQISYK